MMIEQNTNYAYKLKYMDNPTFDKVRDLSTEFYQELPKALQEELYEELHRGVDVLDSEPQMTTYLYAFGMMHQAKLNYAYGKLPREFFELPEINIIDYGCGQALGTMCYADFLRENGYSQKIKTITLIEPSEICLKRAALHASVFFPEADIKTVNKKFDDLTQDDILCKEKTPTLHILSNVLDMLSFDLDSFSSLVKACLKGYNLFVCVGPYFNYSNKDKRMKDFCLKLKGRNYFSESFDRYAFEEDKAWTAQILCFRVGEKKLLLTEVSENSNFRNHKSLKELVVEQNATIKQFLAKDGKYHIFRCGNIVGYVTNDAAKADWKDLGYVEVKTKEGNWIPCLVCLPTAHEEICEDFENGVKDKFGVVYSEDGSRLLKCMNYSLETYNVKNGTKEICDNAFRFDEAFGFGKSLLQYITIPNSVTSIGNMAFMGCSSLQQITIHSSTINIGVDTFCGCKSLQKIIIPENSVEEFIQMLTTDLWDKLYYLKKVEIDFNIEDYEFGNYDLPF